MQVIESAVSAEMPVIDVSSLPQQQREAEALRLAAEEAERPFDLKRDLMLRSKLFRLGPTDHLLILTMHHIVSDGWSVGILLPEIKSSVFGVCRRKAFAAAGTPNSVCGLCGLAACLVAGRSAGKATELLEKTTARGAGLAGSPDGPTTAGDSELPWRVDAGGVAQNADYGLERTEPRRRRYVVHDATGGIPDLAASLHRLRRHCSRLGHGRTQPHGSRAADWLFRQFAGNARRSVRSIPRSGPYFGELGTWLWKLMPIRICRSSGWWRNCIRSGT